MFTQAVGSIFRGLLVSLAFLGLQSSPAHAIDGTKGEAATSLDQRAQGAGRPDQGGIAVIRAVATSGNALFNIEAVAGQVRALVDQEISPRAVAAYNQVILPATALKVIEEQVEPVVTVAGGVVSPAGVTVPANVMYVRFSKNFIRSYFNRRFEKNLPVQDTILGAAVRGTSHTLANTELELVENSKEAQAKLLFRGTTSFNTTSYSGPIQVHSRGATQFSSQKKIWFDGLNVMQSKPTTSAKTETTSTNITTSLPRLRGRIALNIAEDEVAAKRGLAQQITTERTRQRIEQAFEKVAKERATSFTQALREQYAKLPFEGRFALSEIRCSTTPEAIQIIVIGQGEKEPTFAEAPSRLKGNPDIEVHIHSALLQKLVVSAELRKTLQLAVLNMVERPLMSVVKATTKPATVAAAKEPERELKLHWTEGEGLPWLSLAWYETDDSQQKSAADNGPDRVTKSRDPTRK